MSQPSGRLPLSLKLGYGVADVGLNIYFATTGLLLVPFLLTVLGISPAVAGWVMLCPKLWDVVSDPLMGTISDRTRTSWGRRRPYLLAGSLLFPASFVFLFSVPAFAEPGPAAAYVAAFFVISATCFTIFQVPYGSMTAEMTPDYHERTSVTAFRQVFASLGLIAAGSLGPALVAAGGGGRGGYRLMALVLGLISLATLFTCFVATAGAPRREAPAVQTSFWQQFALCRRNRPFVILASTYMVQTLAIAGLMSMIGLVSIYIIRADQPEAATATITASLLVCAMGAMPFWTFLSRRIGKQRAYTVGSVWFAGAVAMFFWVGEGDLGLAVVLAAAAGVGMTSFQLFPWSMLPDTIDHDAASSGERREGIYNGFWTAAQKISLAVGPWLLLLILSVLGFKESTGGTAVVQPEGALLGLRLCFSLVPAAIFLSALAVLRFYSLPSGQGTDSTVSPTNRSPHPGP